MRKRALRVILLFMVFTIHAAISAQADVIYDTFALTRTEFSAWSFAYGGFYDGTPNAVGMACGFVFTAGAQDYLLDSVSLLASSSQSEIYVQVRNNVGGQPGTVLETFLLGEPTTDSVYTGISSTHPPPYSRQFSLARGFRP